MHNDHAECKTAILGLMDALAKIKHLVEATSGESAMGKSIVSVADDALNRHRPLLPRLEPRSGA